MLDGSPHVLDQNISPLHELHEGRIAFRRLQVQTHGAFVAMEVLEVRTIALTGYVFGSCVRRLNLDHVRAPVG
jgi:hypothetical protein